MRRLAGWTAFLLVALVGGRPAPLAAQAAREIVCESRQDRFQYCSANTNGRVRLVRQLSDTRCVLNRTWGFDEQGVWVDRGCRGRFAVAGGGPGAGGWESGDYGRRLTCESRDGDYRECPVTTRGDVRLVRQLSQSPCRPGRSWGFQRDVIWVSDGCRAEFEIGYSNVDWGNGGMRQVTCESNDREYTRCRAWTYGTVRLSRQLSSSPCQLNRSWGYDRDGVWVTNGCRAIFAVGSPSDGGGWGQFPGGGGGTGGNSSLLDKGSLACRRDLVGRGYVIVDAGRPAMRGGLVTQALTVRRPGAGDRRADCYYDTLTERVRFEEKPMPR